MLRLAAGDQQAFAEIIELYAGRIYAHALAYLKNRQIAEEIAQDVLLTVWQQKDKLNTISNFQGWLYVITRNKTTSAFRQMLDTDAFAVQDELDRELQGPDKKLEYKELSETLQRGIEKLPPRRKEVFRLSKIEGLTYDEIALKMGITKSSVNQHMVEALSFLRNWLQSEMGAFFWLAVFQLPFSVF